MPKEQSGERPREDQVSLSPSSHNGIGNRIRGERDFHRTMHPSEREFVRFLLEKNNNPDLIIIYEPHRFGVPPNTTIPDFLIINPRNANKSVYVEITLAEKNWPPRLKKGERDNVIEEVASNAMKAEVKGDATSDVADQNIAQENPAKQDSEDEEVDFKSRQRKIMAETAPDVRYVVLYSHNLLKIQEKNPEFNFFRWMKPAE